MVRPLRVHFDGAIYHVTARGNNKEAVFNDDQDKSKYLALTANYKDKFNCLLYAYALMDNHVHLLLEVGQHPLAKIMQGIQQSYTQYYNLKHKHVGHVFQQRYNSKLCNKDAYLQMVVKYIHYNPVKAGLSTGLDYSWSSHREYLKVSSDIINTKPVLDIFADNRESALHQYIKFMDSYGECEDIERAYFSREEDIVKVRSTDTNIPLADFISLISAELSLTVEYLKSQNRTREAVIARNLIIYLAIKNHIATAQELATEFRVDPSRISRGFNSIAKDTALKEQADLLDCGTNKKRNNARPDPG